MKKLKGVIRNRIHNAFAEFQKDRDLRRLIKVIADVADRSVKSQGNANIMYEQIDKETEDDIIRISRTV